MVLKSILVTLSREKSLLFLLPLIPVVLSIQIEITAEFANSYFQEKDVRQIVVFGCWNNDESVRLFLKLNTRVCYVSISEKLDMTKILKVNYYKLGVLLDFECPNSDIILKQYNQNKLPYNESYFWLIMKDEQIPENSLKELPLSVNTEMTLALHKSENFMLYDVYNPSHRHGGKLNITYMGYWKKQEGIKNYLKQYKYIRRGNFHKLSLNYSIVINSKPKPDFYTYLTTPIDRHLDNMNRFYYNLHIHLRDYYNFTMHLTRGETWGYLQNGSFNGILGDMVKGIVDISVSPFQFKKERYDVAENTVQAYIARASIIFRHPKSNNIRNAFLKPFSRPIWYTMVGTEIMYFSMLYIISKFEKYYYQDINEAETQPCLSSILTVIAALGQQGFGNGPRLYSGRIVFLSLFVWGFLLSQFYAASIVGSLLSEHTQFINSLKTLTKSDLEFGIENMAYNYDFVKTTADPDALELYNLKVAPNQRRKKENFMSAEEGILKVQKGGFAFHVDVSNAYKIIDDTFTEDEICELKELQMFPPKHVTTLIAKHSPFKKMVIYGLRKIVEHGTVERLTHIWLHKKPTCPESHKSKPVPVPLTEFRALIFALFVGFANALFTLFLEILLQKYKIYRQSMSIQVRKISNRY